MDRQIKQFFPVLENQEVIQKIAQLTCILKNQQSQQALVERGVYYCCINQFEKGLSDFDKASNENPLFQTIYFRRGCAYLCLGQYQRAMKNFTVLLKLNPKNQQWLQHKNFIYSIIHGQKKQCPFLKVYQITSNQLEDYIQNGYWWESIMDYRRAIQIYSLAIKFYPNFSRGFYMRGRAYFKIKQYKKALADLNQFGSGSFNSLYNRARLYAYNNKIDKAIEDIQSCHKNDPNWPFTYTNWGLIYHLGKQYKQAIRLYTSAIGVYPLFQRAFSFRGITYLQMKQYDNSLSDFYKAAELNGQNPIHHLLIAKVLLQQGEFDKARVNFEKAEQLANKSIKQWHQLQSYPDFYEKQAQNLRLQLSMDKLEITHD